MFTFSTIPGSTGVSLHVVQGPTQGPPLLLFHGVMRSWRSFAPFAPALAVRHTLVAVDHRGHGHSSRATSYLVRDYIADAIALVERLPGPVILHGHSLGALVACGVAAGVPAHVRAVILEDPPSPAFLRSIHTTNYEAIFRGMQALAGTGATWRDLAAIALPGGGKLGDTRDAASLRLSAAMLQNLDPATLTPLIAGQWLEGLDWVKILKGVQCPCLLLRADETRGGMITSTEADELMHAVADGLRVDFPGVGHQIHWLATEALLRAELAFLESL